MIIPDLNLLIYAYDSSSSRHGAARAWWIGRLSGTETIGLSWLVALGFVRIWTNPRVFRNPMSVELACRHVETWISRPMVEFIHPGPRHASLVFGFLRAEGAAANLTIDAHLAALALEHNAVVHTADIDFHRFSAVRFVNPIR
jgi:toxin-antitoxin system PIN domain toxin